MELKCWRFAWWSPRRLDCRSLDDPLSAFTTGPISAGNGTAIMWITELLGRPDCPITQFAVHECYFVLLELCKVGLEREAHPGPGTALLSAGRRIAPPRTQYGFPYIDGHGPRQEGMVKDFNYQDFDIDMCKFYGSWSSSRARSSRVRSPSNHRHCSDHRRQEQDAHRKHPR